MSTDVSFARWVKMGLEINDSNLFIALNILSFIEFNNNACIKHNLIRKDWLYSCCQKQ